MLICLVSLIMFQICVGLGLPIHGHVDWALGNHAKDLLRKAEDMRECVIVWTKLFTKKKQKSPSI